ncbi:MAG: helix-turn-helix transcriptional regulator [Spirochaetes bacterium]|nr:helix-turn-helix transcriptional regulator [Spirochaetota bacterium]
MILNTRNPLAMRMGLEITGVGKQRSKTGITSPRTLPVYAVVYLADGWYDFRSPAISCRVSAGEAFILFPGIWHTYTPGEPPSLEYWFLFEGFIADRYRENGVFSPADPVFKVGTNNTIIALWEECLTLCKKQKPGFHAGLSRRATSVLQEIVASGRSNRADDSISGEIRAIIAAMKKHLRVMDFNFDGYCAQNNLSVQYTRRRFKRETGYTPGMYFAHMKIGIAKERIISGSDTVTSVARLLGFDDPYYFSRWFTKHASMSPTDYRAAFREWGKR